MPTACEVCGRDGGSCPQRSGTLVWQSSRLAECYHLGYERQRTRAEKLEKALREVLRLAHHAPDCEPEESGSCSCGLSDAMYEARIALDGHATAMTTDLPALRSRVEKLKADFEAAKTAYGANPSIETAAALCVGETMALAMRALRKAEAAALAPEAS